MTRAEEIRRVMALFRWDYMTASRHVDQRRYLAGTR